MLPNAMIIGAQKSGTSALHSYLTTNPLILGRRKELHYFDARFHRSVAHYRSFFPRVSRIERLERTYGTAPAILESTPYYMFHPLVPYRVRGLIPGAKLIVLLREPVQRAVSHHNHQRLLGTEPLPFAEAIEREAERLDGELQRFHDRPLYRSPTYGHFGYLARGRYADQLQLWLSLFPKEQMLVLNSDDLRVNPVKVVRAVCGFLGVPAHDLPAPRLVSARDYPDIDPELRERLYDYFAPHNARLFEIIGERFSWPEPSSGSQPPSGGGAESQSAGLLSRGAG